MRWLVWSMLGTSAVLALVSIYRIDGLKRGWESFLRVVGCFFVVSGLLFAIVAPIVAVIVLRSGAIDWAAWE